MAATLIKKYGNRRLYDTGESRYVTLEELAAKVRAGADVRIVDAQTGEDLTQATLVQIVMENGAAAKFLPIQLLTQMIRLSDDALAEFFSRYVTNALDVYLQTKRNVQSMSAYNPLSHLPAAATDALARMFMGNHFAQPQNQPYGYATGAPPAYAQTPYVAPPPPDEPLAPNERPSSPGLERVAPQRPGTDRDTDVAAMRRELDELKQAIREGLAAKTPAPVPTRKRRKS